MNVVSQTITSIDVPTLLTASANTSDESPWTIIFFLVVGVVGLFVITSLYGKSNTGRWWLDGPLKGLFLVAGFFAAFFVLYWFFATFAMRT